MGGGREGGGLRLGIRIAGSRPSYVLRGPLFLRISALAFADCEKQGLDNSDLLEGKCAITFTAGICFCFVLLFVRLIGVQGLSVVRLFIVTEKAN